MSCCVEQTGGVPSGSGGNANAAVLREFEIDWTAQTPRTLVTGVETFVTTAGDNISFNYTQQGADVVDVSAANGLQWTADAALNNTFTQAMALNCTRLQLPFANLYALLDIDVTWMIRGDTYGTLFTYPAVAPSFNFGIYGATASPANAGVRLGSAGRARQAGVPVWIIQGGSGLNYTTAPGPTTNVTGFTVRNNAIQVHAGTWPVSNDWADLRCPISWLASRVDASPSPPMQDQNTTIIIGWATGGLASGAIVRQERTRFQARSF